MERVLVQKLTDQIIQSREGKGKKGTNIFPAFARKAKKPWYSLAASPPAPHLSLWYYSPLKGITVFAEMAGAKAGVEQVQGVRWDTSQWHKNQLKGLPLPKSEPSEHQTDRNELQATEDYRNPAVDTNRLTKQRGRRARSLLWYTAGHSRGKQEEVLNLEKSRLVRFRVKVGSGKSHHRRYTWGVGGAECLHDLKLPSHR